VTVGARPPIRIALEITLALELKGHATIRAIRIGACRAKASVKCEEITLIERSTKELDLPGQAVSSCRTASRSRRRGPLVFATATMRDVAADSPLFPERGRQTPSPLGLADLKNRFSRVTLAVVGRA
jgi:hypothetical protein